MKTWTETVSPAACVSRFWIILLKMKNLRETINLTNWQTTQGARTPTNPATLWRRTESDDTLLTRIATSTVPPSWRAVTVSAVTTASEQTTCDAHTYWLTACLHSGTPTTPARAVRTTPGLAWPSSELEFYYWQRRTPRFAAAITGDQVAEAAASGLCSSLVYIAQMLWICIMSRAAVFETSCPPHCANMPLIKQSQRLRQETYVEPNRLLHISAADSAF